MGGFFGTVSKAECVTDLFYGTDYNSHLGTKRAGMATYAEGEGFMRSIHNLESSYFRTKFEGELPGFRGKAGIGIISDTDPQPIMINSHLGKFAIVTVAKITNLDELEREAMMRSPETAFLVSDEEFDRQLDELGWTPGDMATRLGMYVEVGMYNMEKKIRDAFRSLLELLFAAASLLIDTVRTFFLVVLSILGPLAFAFSVWDGFQSTLSQWFTRYISVYLWLPVSDLFSCMLAKIQVLMLQNDILELQNNPNYSLDNSNSVYVIFMLIGIIGYFTVPTVAGWIVQAGGAGNYNRNINRTATKAGGFAAGAAGSGLGNIGGRLRGK